jgi:hypothetical protein
MKTQRILYRNIELLKAELKEPLMFLATRYYEIYLYQTLDSIPDEDRKEQIKTIDNLVSNYIKLISTKHKDKLIECAQYLGNSRELVGNNRYHILNQFNLFELIDMMKNSQNTIENQYI